MMKRFITISPIEERKYLATITDDFLKSTYSVCFRDDILGAVALSRFTNMVKREYEKSEVSLELSEKQICFQSPALLDILSGRRGHV